MIDYSLLLLGREATQEEADALKKADDILQEVGLVLIGGRPKDR